MPSKKPANNKTQPTNKSVQKYLASVDHAGRRADAEVLLEMMERASEEPAKLWGTSIIGFGEYEYRYESGREGTHCLTGFAPRKANMVVYIMPGFSKYEKLLEKLGPYKLGKSCLYLGRLDKLDMKVLETLVTRSVRDMRKKYHK